MIFKMSKIVQIKSGYLGVMEFQFKEKTVKKSIKCIKNSKKIAQS